MRHLFQHRYLPWFASVLRLRNPARDSSLPLIPTVRSETLPRPTKRAAKYHLLLSRLIAILACVLVVVAAALFRPSTAGKFLTEAAILTLLGIMALLLSLRLNPGDVGRGEPAVRPYTSTSSRTFARFIHWLAFVLGVVYLAVLAEINGSLLHSPMLSNVSQHVQFALFVVGIVFLTWGIGGGSIVARKANNVLPGVSSTLAGRAREGVNSAKWMMLAITLLAFGLRFWEIGDAVHHLVDEIHFSTAVAYFWLSPEYSVPLIAPFGSITAFPWLFPYLQYGAVNIFGRDLEGLRAVSAVIGTLTVPALYLLARTLFNRRIALLAALLLATFPPHIQFSRIGLNNIADPLFGTLALAFLARGLQQGRRMNFALGGAALGLTQYFYEGGRFLYIFLACLWLIGVIWLGRPVVQSPFSSPSLAARFRRRHALAEPSNASSPPLHRMERGLGGEVRRGIVVFLLTALFVTAPLYYTLYARHSPFASRMDTVGIGGSYWIRAVSVGGGQSFNDQLLTPLLTFVYMPEQALYYAGDQPMILEIFVPLFLLGIGYALWRWRGPGMLLLLWLLLTCLGNMLMTYNAIYARYVVVFPALALLMASGVYAIVPLILPARLNRRIGAPLVAIAIVAVATVQTVYYFGPYLQQYNAQLRTRPDEEDVIFRSVAFPPGTNIHLVTGQPLADSYVRGLMGYLADHLNLAIISPETITPAFLSSLSVYVDHAFYIEPGDTQTPQLLAQRFANLQPPAYSPFNVPRERQYILYYVPSG